MSDANNYGKYYWCVKVTKDVAAACEVYAWADYPETRSDGSLFLISQRNGNLIPVVAFAAEKWTSLHAASAIDGHAVAVEHRKEEVIR